MLAPPCISPPSGLRRTGKDGERKRRNCARSLIIRNERRKPPLCMLTSPGLGGETLKNPGPWGERVQGVETVASSASTSIRNTCFTRDWTGHSEVENTCMMGGARPMMLSPLPAQNRPRFWLRNTLLPSMKAPGMCVHFNSFRVLSGQLIRNSEEDVSEWSPWLQGEQTGAVKEEREETVDKHDGHAPRALQASSQSSKRSNGC